MGSGPHRCTPGSELAGVVWNPFTAAGELS